MKKFVFIVLAAVLVLGGCVSSGGSSGGGSSDPTQDQWWFLSREEGGLRARNNQITLRKGDSYLYVYFRNAAPSTENLDQVQLDFTTDQPITFAWQAAYDDGNVWGETAGDLGTMSNGPVVTNFATFTAQYWGSGTIIDKTTLKGLCLKVNSPAAGNVFTLNDVVFIDK